MTSTSAKLSLEERAATTSLQVDRGKVSTICRQHPVDVASFSYGSNCSVYQPQL